MWAPQVTLTTSERYVDSSQALCKTCVNGIHSLTNPIFEVMKTVWQRRGINLLYNIWIHMMWLTLPPQTM